MKKRLIVAVLALAFAGSTVVTVLTHAAPKCLRCNQCPGNYCWVDCANCCYITYGGDIVCFQ
jgi:hypothetical protein